MLGISLTGVKRAEQKIFRKLKQMRIQISPSELRLQDDDGWRQSSVILLSWQGLVSGSEAEEA